MKKKENNNQTKGNKYIKYVTNNIKKYIELQPFKKSKLFKKIHISLRF